MGPARISIVTNEPVTEGIGGFEWRVDPAQAEREFRNFRTLGSETRLWHGVPLPEEDMTPADITEWVDHNYWDRDDDPWGRPDRIYVGPEAAKWREEHP